MTELRDARLKRALQAAPDASALPSDATRRAIHEAARTAVAKPAAAPWWRRWWGEPSSRMPWNAAFATVLMAVLVGVLWHGEEVPDVKREMPAAAKAPAAPPPAAPAPVAVAPREAAPAPAPAPAPIPQAALRSRESNVGRRDVAQPAPPAPPVAPARTEPQDFRDQPAAKASAELAKSAADTAGPGAVMAPAAAPPAPALRSEAAGTTSQLQRAAIALPAWTEARIASGPRSALFPRSQMQQLAPLLQRLLASANTAEGLMSVPDIRIELMRGTERVGVMELTQEQVRVTETAMPRTGKPDAQLLLEARDEIARLLSSR